MTLTNLGDASNIKCFVVSCYPKEQVIFNTVYSGNIKSVEYPLYVQSIWTGTVTATKKANSNLWFIF